MLQWRQRLGREIVDIDRRAFRPIPSFEQLHVFRQAIPAFRASVRAERSSVTLMAPSLIAALMRASILSASGTSLESVFDTAGDVVRRRAYEDAGRQPVSRGEACNSSEAAWCVSRSSVGRLRCPQGNTMRRNSQPRGRDGNSQDFREPLFDHGDGSGSDILDQGQIAGLLAFVSIVLRRS